MSKVVHISQCIKEIDPGKIYNVPVLLGAVEILVAERYLRNKYQTNRDIKYWSTYFLLKALTTSGKIENWRAQRPLLFAWLQMNENTFYSHLRALKEKGLLTVDKQFNITLVSYKDAAGILDIIYGGTATVPYNPIKNAGNQIFQYIIRAEEIVAAKDRQLNALMYYLDQNPPLRNDLITLMRHHGANEERLLNDVLYFQERLLKLQMQLFRHGSEILEYVFSRRADINRGVRAIQKAHCYVSHRSVSYLKRRMKELKLIEVQKICVESKKRCRIYVPAPGEKKSRDGYKWIAGSGKTAWFLTDQIIVNYEKDEKNPERVRKKEAA